MVVIRFPCNPKLTVKEVDILANAETLSQLTIVATLTLTRDTRLQHLYTRQSPPPGFLAKKVLSLVYMRPPPLRSLLLLSVLRLALRPYSNARVYHLTLTSLLARVDRRLVAAFLSRMKW